MHHTRRGDHGTPIREPGLHMTRRWRKADSNRWSHPACGRFESAGPLIVNGIKPGPSDFALSL
jgi:hypothetical protein